MTVLGGNLQEGQEEYQAVKDGFFKALEHAGELGIAERCPVVLIVDAVNQLKLLLPLEDQTSKTMGQPATEDKDFFLFARASNARRS